MWISQGPLFPAIFENSSVGHVLTHVRSLNPMK
jgi:hypothetical protein